SGYVLRVCVCGYIIVIVTKDEIKFVTTEGSLIETIKGEYVLCVENSVVLLQSKICRNRILKWKNGNIQLDVTVDETILHLTAGKDVTYLLSSDEKIVCLDEAGNPYLSSQFKDVERVVDMKVMSCAMFDFVIIATQSEVSVLCNRHVELVHLATFEIEYCDGCAKRLVIPAEVSDSPENWVFCVITETENIEKTLLYRLDYVTLTKL
ncbi:hypothetical protein EIN_067570, partial [Entamoeba invadens IP1]